LQQPALLKARVRTGEHLERKWPDQPSHWMRGWAASPPPAATPIRRALPERECV
jgi:hypothetical protein